MPERIGLSAVLTTKNFSSGLQTYISGLNRLVQETTQAAAAMNNLTSQLNNALSGTTANANNLSQLTARFTRLANSVTNATNNVNSFVTAARSLAGLPNIPTTPRGGAGGGIGGGAGGGAGSGGRTPAQQDLRVMQLLRDEVKDIVDLEKQRKTIIDSTSSPLQRQLALRQQELIEARQIVRQQELLQAGIQQSLIDRLRGTPRQPSGEQRDLQIAQLLQEELRDTLQLEAARRTLASRTSTEYQKQVALLQQQQIAARQTGRREKLLDLGASSAEISNIRGLPITLKDIQSQAGNAQKATKALTVQAVALGTAIGNIAVSATRAFFNSLGQLANRVISNVTFFEQLGLSVEFYSVRALRAKGITTDFETGLKLVRREAEGTLIWLQRLAVESPFTTKDVGTLFRTAQAYGLLREEAVLLTPLLLDFAAAAGLQPEILERLALAIGQVRARGKLTGEEVRQLGNSGIPIRDILVESLGLANSQFDELVESGALTSDVVIPAIVKALEDFRGAGRRIQFETVGGIVSAFKELAQFASFRFFAGVIDPIKEQFLELFDVLNQTGVTARITAIGEALGRGLSQAMRAATVTIKTFIKSWNALDPVMKRQIIIFGLATVGAVLLAGAIGLITLALKLLLSRVALAVLAVGLFVQAWTNGFKSLASIAVSVGNLISTVFGGISGLFSNFFRSLSIGNAPSELGRTIGDDLNRGFRETQGEIKQEIKDEVDDVAGDALIAGSAAGAEFLRGWKIPKPAQTISKELQEALNRFGAGPQLSLAGARAVNGFLEPFKSLDFRFFEDVGNSIRSVLANAINLGEIEETDLPRLLFGGRRAVAAALNEFRRIGSISRKTLDAVRSNVGSAGNSIVGFLNTYTRLASATDVVEAAQEKLNNITQKYKDIITPIRRELEAISELRRQADENEEILALQRTLNNEAVSGARKRTASLRIEEIRRGATLRGLEQERDLQTEIAEEELSAAQKLQQTLQDEIDLLKARFDAQQAQFNLVGDEASLFRSIQEEISRLREKEKTDLEKQLELLSLMNDEISDAKKLADANFKLRSAETTEFEKQQALLEIQTINFARQQRELKAAELGFDPAILQQLRDVPVMLSDIGEASKAAFQFDTVNDLAKDLGIALPDFITFAEDWNEELGKARQWWVDIKDEISETANVINENLPDFLSIFPDQEGDIPFISNINKFTAAIAGLIFFSPQIVALGKVLWGLARAIGGIKSAVSGGAAAAGAAGAAGTVGAAGGRSLVNRILGFLGPAGLVAAAGLNIIQETNEAKAGIEESITDLSDVFGEQKAQEITQQIDRFLIDSGLSNPLNAINQDIDTSTITDRILEGLRSGESKQEIRQALFDTLTGPTGAFVPGRFANEFLDSLFSNLPQTIPTTVGPLIAQGFDALVDDPVLAQTLAVNLEAIGAQGVTEGLNPVALGSLIRDRFRFGIEQGLIPDTPESRKAVQDYIQGLITLMREESKSQSPSKLFRDEVGIDLGLGILEGIESVADDVDKSVQIKKIADAIATPFKSSAKLAIDTLQKLRKDSDSELKLIVSGLSATYKAFYTDIKAQTATFRADHKLAWMGVRNDTKIEATGIKDDVLSIMDELRLGLDELMRKIYDLIVTNGFRKMRVDAEQEIATMRINVVAQLAGPEDSLLSDLQKALGGTEENTPAWNLGKDLIAGMAQGVEDNTKLLVEAFKTAIKKTLEETAKEYEVSSPSQVAARELGEPLSEGVAVGVINKIPMIAASVRDAVAGAMGQLTPNNFFPSRSSTFVPQSVSNVSSVRNYNLNVNSTQSSQGIVSDFTIMEVMTQG